MRRIIKNILDKRGYVIYNQKSYVESPYYYLKSLNIPLDDVNIINNDKFYLKKIDMEIEKNSQSFFLEGYKSVIALLKKGTRFYMDNGKIMAKWNDLTININTTETINIMKEVFAGQTYEISLNSNKKNVYIDIGMNVGLSTLHFASKKNTEKVFSYEPFPDTYKQALKNISINQSLENKIEANNYGLGIEDKTEIWEYNPTYTGNMGYMGIPDWLSGSHENTKVEVLIKDVSSEIQKIIFQYRDTHNIILKIDCEGSEYVIFDKLKANGLLDHFDAIMMEWHALGPLKLVAHLEKNFSIFSFNDTEYDTGLIYAVKTN